MNTQTDFRRIVAVPCIFTVVGEAPRPITINVPVGLAVRMVPLERNPQGRRAA